MIFGWLPADVSTFGPSIDSMLRMIFYVVGFFFVVSEGAILVFAILYRRKEGGHASFVRGESARELAWILVPAFIVTCFDVSFDVRAKPIWEMVKEHQPPAALTVKLTALQFGWEFTYPGPDGQFGTKDDLIQTNTLTVPEGQVVRLLIESKDVIHSFYVPQLRLRQDAVPGRQIPAWFELTRPGKFEIGCSQLCGVSHFAMKGILNVLTQAQYQQWVAQHWPPAGGAPAKSASTSGSSGTRKEG
jgi:cytochrome c oxidase subunit II